jgi:starch-binding outer membrane protein, SusD/RagB family
MMNPKQYKTIAGLVKAGFFMILLSAITVGCKKDWLDAKPRKSLVVPSAIRDYQALLERTSGGFNDFKNILTEHGAGDFFVSDIIFDGVNSTVERNSYKWASDIFGPEANYFEWTTPYEGIFYTNIALEGIETIVPTNSNEQVEWKQVKGSALFFRAFRHYDIASQFCKPYDKNTATADLGIPLRLTSDVSTLSVRSTVEQTYNQIITDLKQAIPLLLVETPINTTYKCRPNKAAAYGMLARVYLSMSKYNEAYIYADSCLKLYNSLMDFNNDPNIPNQSPTGTTASFTIFNKEVLFHCRANNWSMLLPNRAQVDSLVKLYNVNDRRRDLFFRASGSPSVWRFFGSYEGSNSLFWGGVATDEIYLIRAECAARAGNKDAALADLNALMVKRWRNNGTWVPYTAVDANDALTKILLERRKELCFRGIRWTDLRRLNKEPQFAVTLTRVIKGQTLTLPPNSPLYVFPIPDIVIQLTGMEQNPR